MLILSNNHVLANENKAKKGDHILQPGVFDGGQDPEHKVGELLRFVRLKKAGANLVDGAVASIDGGIEFDHRTLTGLGKLAGLGDPVLADDDQVGKVGRTTGTTKGRVSAFELDNVVVGYGLGYLEVRQPGRDRGCGLRPVQPGGRQRLADRRCRPPRRGFAVRRQRPGRLQRPGPDVRQPDSSRPRRAQGRSVLRVRRSDRGKGFTGDRRSGQDGEEIGSHPPVGDHEGGHGAQDHPPSFQGRFAMKTTGLDEARAAKERAKAIFAGKASVVGIGITRVGDGYGVKVNLDAPPATDAEFPETIDGVPIRIEVVGPIRAPLIGRHPVVMDRLDPHRTRHPIRLKDSGLAVPSAPTARSSPIDTELRCHPRTPARSGIRPRSALVRLPRPRPASRQTGPGHSRAESRGRRVAEIALGISVADGLIDEQADRDQSSPEVPATRLVGEETELIEGGRLPARSPIACLISSALANFSRAAA